MCQCLCLHRSPQRRHHVCWEVMTPNGALRPYGVQARCEVVLVLCLGGLCLGYGPLAPRPRSRRQLRNGLACDLLQHLHVHDIIVSCFACPREPRKSPRWLAYRAASASLRAYTAALRDSEGWVRPADHLLDLFLCLVLHLVRVQRRVDGVRPSSVRADTGSRADARTALPCSAYSCFPASP